ncbi:MAG: transcription termination/antitermination protein NusG [Candidatus Neomarinimicrobiota bacterium]
MDWFSLRVISGKEKKIRESLIIEAERAGLGDSIIDVLVPSENVVEMRDGKKKVRNKVFFTGYLFVKMELTSESRYLVENLNGVISFVGPNAEPQPLKAEEINRILGEVEEMDGREVMAQPFKVGDAVKVVDGPFKDFSGYVQEVNDEKHKVKVTVSIFGRPTPVELEFLQVELEK